MKKTVIITFVALLISSCITRDNPLDAKSEGFIPPAFSLKTIPEDGVVTGAAFQLSCDANNPDLKFRFKLDSDAWSDWQGGTYSPATINDGLHHLEIQGLHPSLENPVNYKINFSFVSKNNSFYFSPCRVKAGAPTVNLKWYGFTEELTSIHVELTKGEIADAKLAGNDPYTKLMFRGKVVDIVVLPGGKALTGSAGVASLAAITLSGISIADEIGFTAIGETKSGKSVIINSCVGTIVE